MLTRIARGLHDLGREVERAQNVIRILEVNHKMNLERAAIEEANVWSAISDAFGCDSEAPSERSVYDCLVLSDSHPYSVRRCIRSARDEGRSMRDHISEEMWLHLNRTWLDLSDLTFERVLRVGRSEFNREIEVFCDAFHGLADDTMIRGESWAFLRTGKLFERAILICRILDIKRKSLALAPETAGDPLEVHQWQALLRSLSGYEPYRRAYDARILPHRVLEFVLQRGDFPRSLTCTLRALQGTLDEISRANPMQRHLGSRLDRLIEQLGSIDTEAIVTSGSFETELHWIEQRCVELSDDFEMAYFTSSRPESQPITAAPGSALVPQQQQQQQQQQQGQRDRQRQRRRASGLR
jgi:uncharacterized alpha-E superfamily protein